MRTLLLATLLGLAGAAGAAGAAGCSRSSSEATQGVQIGSIPTLSVDELEAKLARGECRAVDANTDATRRRFGVIPGAVLLSDYETFLQSELPADKSKGLVFYCANEHCSSSDEAAARAVTAGYTNVKLLPAGITGWAKAGKQTAKL